MLEGDNVNTALPKRSREAIGNLAPQAESGRGATKRKLWDSLANYKMSRVVKNNLPFFHLLTCCPEHQRQFLLETATPEQIHTLVQILFNVRHGKHTSL